MRDVVFLVDILAFGERAQFLAGAHPFFVDDAFEAAVAFRLAEDSCSPRRLSVEVGKDDGGLLVIRRLREPAGGQLFLEVADLGVFIRQIGLVIFLELLLGGDDVADDAGAVEEDFAA